MPTVSVIMPVYNRAGLLSVAVNSVLAQSYGDWELIIVNDGSGDNTDEVAREWAVRWPDRIFYRSQVNKGPAAARNAGIAQARGKYIAFLDADDEWLPSFLEKTVAVLIAGDCDWVDTAAHRWELDENGVVVNKSVRGNNPLPDGDVYRQLLRFNVVGETSKVVIRQECLTKVGVFREDLLISEDWELWLRLAKNRCRFLRIQEPLYVYKVRRDSVTRSNRYKANVCYYKVRCQYAADAFALDAAYRELYAEEFWRVAREIWQLPKRDYGFFIKALVRSQLCRPSWQRILKSLRTQMVTS